MRTILGFFKAVAERRIPGLGKAPSLEGIYNYLPVAERFMTSGQPSEAQLEHIVKRGYHTVLNLAPTSMLENSVVDERRILEAAGARYVHLPVDFKNPTEDDFEAFTELMRSSDSEHLWVHCAANMRVSAFMYRYRCSVLGHDPQAAQEDLLKIWEPFGVWKDFIARIDDG